jgi:hypothetical protein
MCEQLNKYTTTPHSKIGNIKKKSWGDSSSTAKAAFVILKTCTSVQDKSRASEQDIETGPRKKRTGLKQIA